MNDEMDKASNQLIEKLAAAIDQLKSRVPTPTELAAKNGEIERFVAFVHGRFNLRLSPLQALTIWDYFTSLETLADAEKWNSQEWEANMQYLFRSCTEVFALIRSESGLPGPYPVEAK